MTIWLMSLFVYMGPDIQLVIPVPNQFATEQQCLVAAHRVAVNMIKGGVVPPKSTVNIVCTPASRRDSI